MHSHGRKSGGFEKHVARGATRDAGESVRRGRAWHFFGPSSWRPESEPHFRQTARTLALPSKHVRNVEEPAMSGHGRGRF